ncbi:MAG: GAF domain-containing protein, partial [Anaerolineales bacterium]
ELTDGALRMAGGDLSGRVMIQRGDEIGLLAQAFNSMAEQLQASYQDLEDKIESRTRQLETAAEVGRAVSSIVSSEELLSRTVELIRARFGYYHASVFLLDEAGEYAVLRASTGEVGAKLLARGYRLAVGSNSIIGWVTAHRQARVALDVSEDPIHLKNELLPDTRSEAAIPLNVGDRVIGTLDVQSREPNAFTQADLHALQILADQVAVGVENSRLFARQAQIMRLEQLVANLTSKIHRARRLDTILESAATELGRALGARRVVVRLASAPESDPPDRASTPSEPTDGNGRRNANGEPHA